MDIHYVVRVPGDGLRSQNSEFQIEPRRGVLSKHDKSSIDITFTPMNAQKYDMVLVVDLEGVG